MKENISLKKNSFYSVLYRLTNILFNFISTLYIARVLMPKEIGLVMSAQNFSQYFLLISSGLILNYGIREISKTTNRNKVFSELLIFNSICVSIISVLYFISVSNVKVFNTNIILYMLVGIPVAINLFNVEWYYFGIEEYKFISIRNALVKTLCLIMIFAIVKSVNDYMKYVVVLVLATVLNHIINFIHLKDYQLKFQIYDINVFKHIKPVCVMLASVLCIEIYTLVDVTMLNILSGPTSVAYYNYAIQIPKILITLITSISAVLLPRLSALCEQKEWESVSLLVNKYLMVLIYFFLPCNIGLNLLAENIIYFLYGNGFTESVPILKIASSLILTLGFSNLFGTQILISLGLEKNLLKATIAGAFVNISLNIILIQRYGSIGAIVASVISELIVTVITIYYSNKYIRVKIQALEMLKMILSAVIMSISIILIKIFVTNLIVELIIITIVSGTIYILLNEVFGIKIKRLL